MTLVKIFSGTDLESLEGKVNVFLTSYEVLEVVDIKINTCVQNATHYTIAVVYKKNIRE